MMLRLYTFVIVLCLCGGMAMQQNTCPAVAGSRVGQAQFVPLRLAVRQDAVVFVPFGALAAAGWLMAVLDPSRIHVTRHGHELAVEQSAGGLRFVATSNDSPHTAEAAYWLTVEEPGGIRMALPAASYRPFIWEADMVYQPAARTVRGDRWFAAELRAGIPWETTVQLPQGAARGSALEMTLTTLEPMLAHRIAVRMNGAALLPEPWFGAAPARLRLTMPVSVPAGEARIQITSLVADDTLLLDTISLPDVMVAQPEVAAGVLAPRMALPPLDVDTVIVTHAGLREVVTPLAEFHRAQGQRVAVVDVQAAYDAYSFGERDPQAIRTMLRAMQPPPARVVLVGAGSVRTRAAPGEADATLVPTILVDADPKNGEIACDTCFARFDGDDVLDDPMPDAQVGRLPAHSPAEADILIAKTVRSLGTRPAGAWRMQALLVADNDLEPDGTPDPAGPFTPTLAQLAQIMTPALSAQRFVYAPAGSKQQGDYQDVGALRTELLSNWNRGAALVVYAGHASPWQWAWTGPHAGVAHLFHLYDADSLANGERLPIVLSLTCRSGDVFNPTLQATDERLLVRQGGGIAAALSPVGSGVSGEHTLFGGAVVAALVHGATLGMAHQAGLEALARSEHDLDLVFGYQLLGDPDLSLPGATNRTQFLALVTR